MGAAFLAACGGGDGPTKSDAATVRVILGSGAAVQSAFTELYSCVPQNKACYTSNGATARTVVDAQRQRVEAALEETDAECLRDVGELYLESLDGYAAAAEAAAAGRPPAFDEAISRTTETEIAYNRKLGDCGFEEGRSAEIGAAIREVNVKILQLNEEIADCLRPACVHDVAERMEKSASEGVSLLEDYKGELEGAPDCMVDAFDRFRESFRALASAARAIQENEFAKAESDGARSGQLALEAQSAMAACLGSLGA